MSEAIHTPGPWKFEADAESLFIQGQENGLPEICLLAARKYITDNVGFAEPVFTNEDYANARLIAAAPDFFKAVAGEPDLLDQPIDWVAALLAAYEQICEQAGYKPEDPDAEWQMKSNVRALVSDVRSAIQKATGQ